jgi:hypothetical protein
LLSLMAVVFSGWVTNHTLAQGPWQVTTSATASTARAAEQADRRDALLMLDSGPLHLRMHVAIGGA